MSDRAVDDFDFHQSRLNSGAIISFGCEEINQGVAKTSLPQRTPSHQTPHLRSGQVEKISESL